MLKYKPKMSDLCSICVFSVYRKISTINRWLEKNGYDADKMWRDTDDVIIKTIISAHAVLKHNYRTCFPNHVRGSACFEILGFDVMLDKRLKPYVLEVRMGGELSEICVRRVRELSVICVV